MKIITVVIAAVGLLIAAWPASPVNEPALRAAIVARWRAYDGIRYVWGGEGRFGIDCSGLMRRGLIEAEVQQGFRHENPALLRAAFSFWWYDETAKEMGLGARGFTRVIGQAESLNALPPDHLLPGDLAVTRDGMHVLGYAGNGVWIEADPSEGKVIEVQLPSKSHWFNTPVTLVRWTAME